MPLSVGTMEDEDDSTTKALDSPGAVRAAPCAGKPRPGKGPSFEMRRGRPCGAPSSGGCRLGHAVTSFSLAMAPVVSPGSFAAGHGRIAMEGVVSSGDGIGAMPAEIMVLNDAFERFFYETECMKCNWNVRKLRRQIKTNLYVRAGIIKYT